MTSFNRIFVGPPNGFVEGIIGSYIVGALYSNFNVIAYTAVALNLAAVFLHIIPGKTASIVHKCLWISFTLSMFTIWLEPWVSAFLTFMLVNPAQHAYSLLEVILGALPQLAFTLVIDTIVTGIWFTCTTILFAVITDR